MEIQDSRISILPTLEFEGIPEGTPKKIKASPNVRFYMDAIRSGWSIRQLESYALKHFGEEISRDTFHRFRLVVPTQICLPETYRKKFLNDIDARIDCLQEIQNIAELQKQRVTISVTAERLRNEKSGGLAGVSPETRAEILAFWTIVKETTSLMTNLGMLGGARSEDIPSQSGIPLEQVKMIEFAESMPLEKRDQIKEICQEIIRGGGNGAFHEVIDIVEEEGINVDLVFIEDSATVEVKDA